MKTLAVVCEDLSPPFDEGFKKATVSLIRAIAGLGVETVVFTHDTSGLPGGLHTSDLPRNKLLLGRPFAGRLRGLGADAILYVPSAAATPMSMVRACGLRRQSGGAPVAVLSLQAREYPRGWARLVRLFKPDLVLTLSQRTCRAAEQAGLEARVVRLGVDGAVFRPGGPVEKQEVRRRYGIPGGKVILHVGHVSARRNLDLLRRAAAAGAQTDGRPGQPDGQTGRRPGQPDGQTGRHLVIVASTSTSRDPEVRRSFDDLPVTFIDTYVEHVEEIYRAADCYVFPTFCAEGAIELPLSVLEALASGLPVVTTSFGGIPEALTEGGGLFIAGSELEFLEKLETALAIGDTTTRDLVADLTWENAATGILEALRDPASPVQPKQRI